MFLLNSHSSRKHLLDLLLPLSLSIHTLSLLSSAYWNDGDADEDGSRSDGPVPHAFPVRKQISDDNDSCNLQVHQHEWQKMREINK